MKDKAEAKMETYCNATECWKCGSSGVAIKHMKNAEKNYLGLDGGVGISNNKQNNSINSHVTNYTTGVHSTGDWSDWYNVPYNLTISCVCIPGCHKNPITRRKLSEHIGQRINRNITKYDLKIQCKACIFLLNSVGYGDCIYCNRIRPLHTRCCDYTVDKIPKK